MTASFCPRGHSSRALYATLAERGSFPVDELASFDAIDLRLQARPDMNLLPGLDMSKARQCLQSA